MSNETPTPSDPKPPKVEITNASPSVVAGGFTAESYISQELQKAKAALKRTQFGGAVLLVLLGGYLYYLTSHFTSQLQPHTAAEIADGVVMQQITDKGPDLQAQLKQKIPELIAQTPDYVLKQLPEQRKSLEEKVMRDLNKVCSEMAPKLGQELDTFLDTNKDQVKALIDDSNDPNTAKHIGPSLKETFVKSLQSPMPDGGSVKQKIDDSLASLREVENKIHKLAEGKNLTPEEKKARRAIAVLTSAIDKQATALRGTPSTP